MNVNSLANIVAPYIQSLISSPVSSATNNGAGIDPSSLALPQESSPQLSPFARVLSTLQQLQQTDPAKYRQVTAQIATNLQNAAQTATANGNTAQATELNQLAIDFKNASQSTTLPSIQDLAKTIGGAHRRHHHHHDTQASSSDPAGASSNSNSPSGATSGTSLLSQLIAAFLGNSTSTAQQNTLDPLSIINNTLSGANLL